MPSNTTKAYIKLIKDSLLNKPYFNNELRILYLLNIIDKIGAEDQKRGFFGRAERKNVPSRNELARQLHLAENLFDKKMLEHLKKERLTGGHLEDNLNVLVFADTMIGEKRLDNIQYCVEQVLNEGVEGDFIECGVWQGGATIFMRALLQAYEVVDRTVWVADSFEGLPDSTLEVDIQGFGNLSKEVYPALAVSEEQVRANFEKYDLLDEQVKFLKGWFKDTLAQAPIEKLAILRLDGDLYESTMDALKALYHKVSIGGFVIIDDYFLGPCREAVTEFRSQHNINAPLLEIDDKGIFWKKDGDEILGKN
jgi:O-methyltransferase